MTRLYTSSSIGLKQEEAKLQKHSTTFYSLSFLVDIFATLKSYWLARLYLRTPSIDPQKFVLMSSSHPSISAQWSPAKMKNSWRWTVRKMQKTNILWMENWTKCTWHVGPIYGTLVHLSRCISLGALAAVHHPRSISPNASSLVHHPWCINSGTSTL